MKYVRLCLAAAFLLSGCKEAARSEPSAHARLESSSETIKDSSAGTRIMLEDGDIDFRDVLQQYQDLNARLAYVSYRLQKTNAALCPTTQRDAGFTVHLLTDYPKELQPIAREWLSASDRISVRTVREGSSAAAVGLRPGDQIVQIFGSYVPSGPTSKTLYDAAAKRAFAKDETIIQIRRGEQRLSLTLTPETLCGYPANLFFSERINGHTDGREVWITSELIRSEPEDAALALVIAHEMAHAIAGHTDRTPSTALELEADRMGLIMLARAGYDIESAVRSWDNATHPHGEPRASSIHPDIHERRNNFNAVKVHINAQRRAGKALTF